MASYNTLKSSMSLVLDLGVGPDGKGKSKTVTLSRLKASATADAVDAVADALSPLLAYPVLEVLKTDTDGVAD
ncbi:protein of unknown function DUF1659 [Aminomonas paucivorans DSM 12260]|uniref:DUF1659 domain-containing protein n=1 Tax=Aminomonas paucivorans DSM 12260 TaxID=584708 RepID=E3CZW5_9BACT|nr:DUF1659 domain-containing protein [Aminomonas paucivorans]EFQ22897.1 protein of unknown function DUF1659 [Aminomonas paucivorans DSM 12260]